MAKKKKEIKVNEVLETESDVIRYIESHKEWWFIAKLQNFVDRISLLTNDRKLMKFFALQIGKIRTELQNKRTAEDAIAAQHFLRRQKAKMELEKKSRQSGDIYGEPKFYRFGEWGNSRKKGKTSGFLTGE